METLEIIAQCYANSLVYCFGFCAYIVYTLPAGFVLSAILYGTMEQNDPSDAETASMLGLLITLIPTLPVLIIFFCPAWGLILLFQTIAGITSYLCKGQKSNDK